MKKNLRLKSIAILLFLGGFVSKGYGQIYYNQGGEMEEVTVFYLGFDNKITFNIFESVSQVTSPNGKVIQDEGNRNSFTVVTSSKDSLILNWKSNNLDASGNSVVTDHSAKYPVKLLPKAELCLGNTKNEGKLDLSNMTLNYSFPEGTPKFIKAGIHVDKWVVSIPGAKKGFSGTGAELTPEVIDAIKKAKGNKSITISTVSSDKKVYNSTFVK